LWRIIPKSIVAIRTEKNEVIREEMSVFKGVFMISFLLFALLMVPYIIVLIIVLGLNGLFELNINFSTILISLGVFHILLSYFKIGPMIRAYNAFGKESSKYVDV